MPPTWLILLFCAVVLTFLGMVALAIRSWPRISNGRRIGGTLALIPHLLLIVCVVVSVSYGHPRQGSPGFNTQFACDVLIVFILPVPALVGTLTAFALLLGGRKR